MKELLEGLGYPVVELPLSACETREASITYMVAALVQSGKIEEKHARELIVRLSEREQKQATVLGNGLAMPHLATETVDHVIGIVGLASRDVPWPGGFDDAPIRSICLLLTPASKPLETLLAEEFVVRQLFRSEGNRQQAIRLRAYRYWQAAGCPVSTGERFWFLAERDLMANR